MVIYKVQPQWTLHNVPMGVRFWSGIGDLEFDGFTWNGVRSPNNDSALMSVSAVEFSEDAPNRRAQITLDASPPEIRDQLLQDFGPLTVELGWIYSEDDGRNWRRIPRLLVGRLSGPIIEGGLYTVDIETYTGDGDRVRPLIWSHATQMRLYPNDLGLVHVNTIASGFETTWPP